MAEPQIVEPTTALAFNPQSLVAQAIESKADPEILQKLLDVAERAQAIHARAAFYDAMAKFAAECPEFKKTKRAKIASAKGSYSYTYAPLDEITRKVGPVMGKHGLSYKWPTRMDKDGVYVVCRISHRLGHSEDTGEVFVPVTNAATEAMGAGPAQRVGIALTYAKRYSLMTGIGQAPQDDTDGHVPKLDPTDTGGDESPDGGQDERTITEPQSKRLFAIAREYKWTDEAVAKLLKVYGVEKPSELPMRVYDAFINQLKAGPKPEPAKAPSQDVQGRL